MDTSPPPSPPSALDLQQPTDTNAVNLAWRFVVGTVKETVENSLVYLTVQIPQRPEIKSVRLIIDPAGKTAYQPGSPHPVFLIDALADRKGCWRAVDDGMADFERNPWCDGSLRAGDIVEGTVIRYVEGYAAIVRLDCNLTQDKAWQFSGFTGFLHVNRTPDGVHAKCRPDISDVLHIGDTVQSMVVKLEPSELKTELDVNEWLELRQKELEVEPVHKPVTDSDDPFPTLHVPSSTDRPEKKLLLLDDDLEFCRTWQKTLAHWNVRVRYCQPPTAEKWREHLERETFDGCLVDCNLCLPSQQEEAAVQRLLQQLPQAYPAMRVLRISGDTSRHEEGVLNKIQLSLEVLLPWLDWGTQPLFSPERRQFSLRWQVRGAEQHVNDRAREMLWDCCGQNTGHRILWVREERAGFYAIHVAIGVQDHLCRHLESELGKTFVATALKTGLEQSCPAQHSGALKDVFGEDGHVWIMPLRVDGHCDRALVLHSARPLEEAEKARIYAKQGHMADLVEWQEAALALENNETFAREGVLLAGTLHEVRTAASVLNGISSRLVEWLRLPGVKDLGELAEEAADLARAAARVTELSDNGLDHVRPEQAHITDLSRVVAETLRLMQGRMKALGKQARLELRNSLPGKQPLALAYPAKFVEIPLVNLLDNAFHHLGNRPWAKISVSIELDEQKPGQPLLIRVQDTGLGMTAGRRQQLFQLRRTGRGAMGSGLGLYLSRQLLEAIGGSVEQEHSVRWLGSRFAIRLPYKV